MANLYMEVVSERTQKHAIGNRFLEVKIYYGSREDSRLLAHILVKPESKTESLQFFQFSTQEPKPMVLNQKPLELIVKT